MNKFSYPHSLQIKFAIFILTLLLSVGGRPPGDFESTARRAVDANSSPSKNIDFDICWEFILTDTYL